MDTRPDLLGEPGDFLGAPHVIADPRFPGRGHPERLGNRREVPHKVERDGGRVVVELLGNAFVSRGKRRVRLRIVRFWRSTNEVLMWRASGLPVIATCQVPVHFAGRYRC